MFRRCCPHAEANFVVEKKKIGTFSKTSVKHLPVCQVNNIVALNVFAEANFLFKKHKNCL